MKMRSWVLLGRRGPWNCNLNRSRLAVSFVLLLVCCLRNKSEAASAFVTKQRSFNDGSRTVFSLLGTSIARITTTSSLGSSTIPPPPSISMPVWSLATPSLLKRKDDEGASSHQQPDSDTSMNIVTFCTAVSVAPPKRWIVSLYHNTLTKDSFLDAGEGVLQLLRPSQGELVPVLGMRSGYEEGYSKEEACAEVGYPWVDCRIMGEVCGKKSYRLLPECALYVQLKLLSATLDAGDHIVALCEATRTLIWDSERESVVVAPGEISALDESCALYTSRLRSEGIL